MGGLLPNGNDIDVINQLNTQFTGDTFDDLIAYVKFSKDDFLWGPGKTLARASYRLNIWPTSTAKARRRWFAFLGRILSPQNQADIQSALKTSVQNAPGNIVGVHFWAQYDPSVAKNSYVVQVTDEPADGAGNIFKKVTLLCDHEIPAKENGDPDPGPDKNEKGPEHPLPKKILKKSGGAKGKPRKKKAKAKKKSTSKKGIARSAKRA
jgi:hypothetical protein